MRSPSAAPEEESNLNRDSQPKYDFNVGYATDIGRKRAQNQDSLAVDLDAGLFVVADGMGGHRGGETASHLAVDTIPRIVQEAQKNPHWNARQTIADAIEEASARIFDRASKEPQLQGMGTTTIAIVFKGDRMIIGHVGDSRCYYLTPSAIWQATRDHSLVQEKLRAGLITRAEVKTDKMKNVITRSVGFEEDAQVEVYEMPARPGDVFLLCSDGLSGQLEDDEILQIVQEKLFQGQDVDAAVKELIDRANKNGGDDNITTIVVQLKEI